MKNKKLGDKKIKQIVFAIIGLGILYFMYKKMKGDKDKKKVDTGDNPMTGSYQGNKKRSQGNSQTTTTTLTPTSSQYTYCIPAMDSEGGGKGKFISIDDPHTPGQVEIDRRNIVDANLNVGDTIDLDGRSCKIKKFWVDDGTKYPDGRGRKSAIACENHSNITYNNNSKICW